MNCFYHPRKRGQTLPCTKDFMEGGKAQLQRDACRHTEAWGVEKRKKENAALRDLVADKKITIHSFKKTFGEENSTAATRQPPKLRVHVRFLSGAALYAEHSPFRRADV